MHEKDFRSKTLIREAIMENDFLQNLSPNQVCFHSSFIISEGVLFNTCFGKNKELTLLAAAVN